MVAMARKKAKATATRSGGVTLVNVAPPPPVRRSSGSRTVSRRRSGGGKRRRRSSVGGGSTKSLFLGAGMGGFAVGFIEKTFGDKIPTLPYIGRKGAIALACHFFGNRIPFSREIGLAAASLSGYQFAKEGKVDGEDDYVDGDDDMLTT